MRKLLEANTVQMVFPDGASGQKCIALVERTLDGFKILVRDLAKSHDLSVLSFRFCKSSIGLYTLKSFSSTV